MTYKDDGTKDVAASANTKAARKSLPVNLHQHARRRLAYLVAARSLEDLKAWTGLGLHPLKADRHGQYAIRINDQYRICFRWTKAGAEECEITDYH